MLTYILIFIASIFLLVLAGKWLVDGLIKMAAFLKVREFVVAFFIVAMAGSMPNFFFGVISALEGLPQLAFGDAIGGNFADLTVIVALSVIFGKGLPARSKMVQSSAIFTSIIALLPLLLIFDGILSRSDGMVLIFSFIFYAFWLFSKKDRFSKSYNSIKAPIEGLRGFFKGFGKVLMAVGVILLASKGMVEVGSYLAFNLNIPLVLVGMLIVGLGNCFPEAYFTVVSARRGENWMLLGDLMGVVMVASTLVLGTVAIICPIIVENFSPYVVARVFLIAAAIFFLIFVRTDRKITKKEGIFLLFLYVLFVVIEILIK